MGIYVNPGNTFFKEALNSMMYVDKSHLKYTIPSPGVPVLYFPGFYDIILSENKKYHTRGERQKC